LSFHWEELLAEEKKGARDISDLKARLGLKKGGAPAPAAGPPGASPLGAGRAVPAPPGFSPPPAAPPAPAPPPDPRRDPFGAAAAAAPAPQMMYQYAPLPGTDDGMPATPMSKPKPWGRIISFGIVAAAAIGAGYIGGRACGGRENYNMTIDQAGQLSTELEKIYKQVGQVAATVQSSPNVAKGMPDVDLAAKLGELNFAAPDTRKIFHTNYFFLEDLALENLFTFYNDVIRLQKLVEEHAKKTDGDKDAIANYLKSGAANSNKNYGVVLDFSGALALAHFVEVGTPVCPKEGQTDCNANELKGFKYRSDTGGSWFEKPVKGKPGDVVFPMQQTPLFKAIAAGNPDVLAAKDAARRQAEVLLLLGKIANEYKELSGQLKRAAEKPKVFTF
jgi:hypothetical protein